MNITRFAPSPTGYLHLGNVRTALFNWLLAKHNGGTMQLRLEDTDRARSANQYETALVEDLNWLGLDFSGDADGTPWRQSQRTAYYQEYIERLGEHCYPCFCSNEELAAQRQAQLAAGKPPRYNGTCAQHSTQAAQQRLATGAAAVWRFRVPRDTTVTVDDFVRGQTVYATDAIGDFILRRSNGDFSFIFTNALDDALLGVNRVLRGEDHTTNTPRQLLLLQALSLPVPQYGHIALMVAAGGKPLSKRDGLTPVRDWRARGYLPLALLNYLARVGHSYRHHNADALMTLQELSSHFSTAALGRAPAQYDAAQLLHWQKDAVMALSMQEYQQWLGNARLQGIANQEMFCQLTQENVVLPDDSEPWLRMLREEALSTYSETARAAMQAAGNEFYTIAAAAATAAHWQDFCSTIKEKSGKKGKALFLPLRAALTGATDGPAMPLVYEILTPQQRRTRLLQGVN